MTTGLEAVRLPRVDSGNPRVCFKLQPGYYRATTRSGSSPESVEESIRWVRPADPFYPNTGGGPDNHNVTTLRVSDSPPRQCRWTGPVLRFGKVNLGWFTPLPILNRTVTQYRSGSAGPLGQNKQRRHHHRCRPYWSWRDWPNRPHRLQRHPTVEWHSGCHTREPVKLWCYPHRCRVSQPL